MEVLVNAAGKRIYVNGPQWDDGGVAPLLYDPNNSSNSNLGLYDRTQQTCQSWENQFFQFQRRNPRPPQNIVDRDGRTFYAEQPRAAFVGQNFVAYKR